MEGAGTFRGSGIYLFTHANVLCSECSMQMRCFEKKRGDIRILTKSSRTRIILMEPGSGKETVVESGNPLAGYPLRAQDSKK